MLVVRTEQPITREMRNKIASFCDVEPEACLLYTSDAADDTPCVDLGGRRIINKKKYIILILHLRSMLHLSLFSLPIFSYISL